MTCFINIHVKLKLITLKYKSVFSLFLLLQFVLNINYYRYTLNQLQMNATLLKSIYPEAQSIILF